MAGLDDFILSLVLFSEFRYSTIKMLFKTVTEVLAVTDEEALNAAFCLTEMEGIIPALESAHALAVLEQKTFRPEEIVVINLSGRGDKDMQTYKRMNKFLHL